jgi:enoyl-CoA hydratase/carnithine racemase
MKMSAWANIGGNAARRVAIVVTTAGIDEVKVQCKGHVVHAIIDRPERKNALTLAMYSSLSRVLQEVDRDSSIRAIVLSGAAGSFTSGNDLSDFLTNPDLAEGHPVLRFMRALSECRKPVVAAVSGPAIGIGTTLLLHCDLVYAGESARFQTPFATLGLCPEFASSLLLPQRMGYVQAAQMLLLGDAIDASQALAGGLVNAVVADATVVEHALAVAARLAAQPPTAVRATKALMREGLRAATSNIMKSEIRDFVAGLQIRGIQRSGECVLRETQTRFFSIRVTRCVASDARMTGVVGVP